MTPDEAWRAAALDVEVSGELAVTAWRRVDEGAEAALGRAMERLAADLEALAAARAARLATAP